MKPLICEMCGSHDIVKKDGYFVCQACETKYTVEEARKMMGSDTVKIDNTAKLENYYKIARQARDNNDDENAAKYYDLIMQEDPTSWEATFYNVYFRAMQTTIGRIASAATSVENCLDSVLELVKTYVEPEEERRKTILVISLRLTQICTILESAAKSHMKSGVDKSRSSDVKLSYIKDYLKRTKAVSSIQLTFADAIERKFPNDSELRKIAVSAWKSGVQNFINSNDFYDDRVNNRKILDRGYGDKIRVTEPDYKLPAPIMDGYPDMFIAVLKKYSYQPVTSQSGGGCYVATAVYGSYDCPQVWTLRRFRDYTLAKTWYGRAFIRTYYAISPTLVKWFGHTDWFKRMWKGKLDRMVANLNASGVKNTPYKDKVW